MRFFPFEFSLTKSFRNQIATEYLRKLVLLHSKQIRGDLNELE